MKVEAALGPTPRPLAPTDSVRPEGLAWRADHWQDEHAADQLATMACEQLHAALGLCGRVVPSAVLRRLVGRSLKEFSRQVLAFDREVASMGLSRACASLLPRVAPTVVAEGVHQIPTRGPLLVVSNHPGLYDAVALAACLPRDDVRAVAKHQAYWELLPSTSRRLFVLDEQSGSPRSAMKSVTRHLGAGGAVLLFPGGRIEPDPAHCRGAAESVLGWSRSPEWIASLLDDVTIVPAAVGGVLSPRWLRSPLTRVRRAAEDRRWLAATLQFLLQSGQDVVLRVSFGEPIHCRRRVGRLEMLRLRDRLQTAVRRQLLRVDSASRRP